MYTRSLPELPGAALDDWRLLGRLQQLFDPYRPIVTGREGWQLFTATDARGEYTAATIGELRQLIGEQDEPPHEIRLFVAGRTPYGQNYELGVNLGASASRALLYGESEEMVDHVAARLQALLKRDAADTDEPRAPAAMSSADDGGLSAGATADARERERLHSLFYDPWVITVGGGLVVIGATALIAYLAGAFG